MSHVDNTIQSLSVFTGSGMLDTAVELAAESVGIRVRPVGYVERDAFAARLLMDRMEAKTLGYAPVWCDCLSRLDARPLRGFVDLLIASPPCQPYSSAGKRRGNADHRSHGGEAAPLPHLVRIIDESGVSVVFFENVPEWVADGHFQGFGEELCRLGFEIEEPLFLASEDLGGSHGRERVFVLAHSHGAGLRAGWKRDQGAIAFERGPGVAEPASGGLGAGGQPSGVDRLPSRGFGNLADPKGAGHEGEEPVRRGCADGRAREFVRPLAPPARPVFDDELARFVASDRATLGAVRERIAGTARALGHWARLFADGLPATSAPWADAKLPMVADGLGYSNGDLLRVGGNGVDPLVAAVAFRVLWDRAVDRYRVKGDPQ